MDSMSSEPRGRARLELAATVLLILVSALLGGLAVWDRLHSPAPNDPTLTVPPEQLVPTSPVSIKGAPTRGDRNARVALIGFLDLECSYCGRSAREVLPDIEGKYVRTGKLLLAWRNFPLAIHEHAWQAAEAAECASRQGRFWDFQDWALQHQSELDNPHLRAAAAVLGLQGPAFDACLTGEGTKAVIEGDIALGNALSVTGTPTWFVGVVEPSESVRVTARISGAKRFQVFQTAIEEALTSVEAARK